MLIKEKNHPNEVKQTSTIKKVIRKEIIKEKSVTLCAEEPTVRYLKLQPSYRESHKKVPELRFSGIWLEKAGFLPENYVSITVMNGLLVIRSIAVIEASN